MSEGGLAVLEIALLGGLVVVLLIFSSIFSGSEVALMACRRHLIRSRAQQGSWRARLVMELLDQPERLLSTILVGNNIANTGAVSVATYVFLQLTRGQGEVVAYTTILMTVTILLVSEITPKSMAAHRADEWALWLSPFLYFMMIVIYPVIRVLGAMVRLVLKGVGIQPQQNEPQFTLEELRGLLMMARRYRERLDEEVQMMVRVSDLPLTSVSEIMIHRDQVVMIELGTPLETIEAIIFETGYSRFPVYQESTDNVIGILYVKDYFRARKQGRLTRPEDIRVFLREPIKVLSGTRVDQVLKVMRERKVHIALVFDEFGGFEGICTLEDILEEIVGEIEDEFDIRQEAAVVRVDAAIWDVWAQLPIKDLNEFLPEPLPESADYRTLAGFLIKQRDAIPEEGEEITFGPYHFRVLQKRGHRLQKIRIAHHPSE